MTRPLPAVQRLKGLWPDSLSGRAALVMLLGLALAQILAWSLYSLNRSELSASLRAHLEADRVVAVIHLAETTPRQERDRLIQGQAAEGLHLRWSNAPTLDGSDQQGPAAELASALRDRLPGRTIQAAFARPFAMMLPPGADMMTMPGNPPEPPPDLPPPDDEMPRHGHHHPPPRPVILITCQLDSGDWLTITFWPRHIDPVWRGRLALPLLVSLAVVCLLSFLAVRRAAAPLALLAQAAQRLGRDVSAPPIPVKGPREVREAARSFNEMQMQLRRFIDDRTQMIAAISHDLRTPITRLRLRAEFLDDEELQKKVLADLDEMEAMIRETLAFARDDATREERTPVDLSSVLTALCAETGIVCLPAMPPLIMQGGKLALKRAFANLLQNARQYGGSGELSLQTADGSVTIIIDDHGPGLPDSELEKVFTPFYRAESSRNRRTGGTGLGLSVARSAIRAHGGDIILCNRSEGGLRATVTLPL